MCVLLHALLMLQVLALHMHNTLICFVASLLVAATYLLTLQLEMVVQAVALGSCKISTSYSESFLRSLHLHGNRKRWCRRWRWADRR